ncbi:hypothetical protein [Methylobacterium aerolatum]|uniref:Septum formation inhibitor-activating ATPase n=1 Tax=Methylobacterium aerolatum TaxID=418708 RepID=A0ABU0I0L5_9HYPH|nr:hypothetical protein [Methylobacterium aerolatum]MDQ0448127.1 hypothetical protein [Methylobacterium aerolatum]GJD34005.1 hypothetical protein FMGBMHLM_0901 [Methylobacterium aerolatum]
MPTMSLAELDRLFADEPHLHLVKEMQLDPGGVDPLGLRQINLNLMDAALPGINNVTRHVRPYAFMAWAWWKVAQAAEARGASTVNVADLQDVVDRLEVLFVWSHFLAGDGEGLPGRLVINDKFPGSGSKRAYDFHGEGWKSLKAVRRTSTGIMAPIQYGPSIRALGWLIQTQERALRPSSEAMTAVAALDREIGGLVPEAMLVPGPISLRADQADALHSAWPVSSPSVTEREAFKTLFHGLGANAPMHSVPWRRRQTLDLILAVLAQAKEAMGVVDIRRAMASARNDGGQPLKLTESLAATHMHWASLQARQLQRLALESLLRWIETRIDEGRSLSEELAADADEAAREVEDDADVSTVGDYLDRAAARAGEKGWPSACGLGETDIFRLMDDLVAAQSEVGCVRVPGLALRALAYADAMAVALSEAGVAAGRQGPLGGEPDRLPLSIASQRLKSARGRGLRSLWIEIIEAWVIGQHVRWSVARNGDGTQRLRIALGDRGWIRLRSGRLSGPFGPTSDRLWTAMALAAECGLVDRRSTSTGDAYIAA